MVLLLIQNQLHALKMTELLIFAIFIKLDQPQFASNANK
jgi:hypothetical protein